MNNNADVNDTSERSETEDEFIMEIVRTRASANSRSSAEAPPSSTQERDAPQKKQGQAGLRRSKTAPNIMKRPPSTMAQDNNKARRPPAELTRERSQTTTTTKSLSDCSMSSVNDDSSSKISPEDTPGQGQDSDALNNSYDCLHCQNEDARATNPITRQTSQPGAYRHSSSGVQDSPEQSRRSSQHHEDSFSNSFNNSKLVVTDHSNHGATDTTLVTAELVEEPQDEAQAEIRRLREQLEGLQKQEIVHAEPVLKRQHSSRSSSSRNSQERKLVNRKRPSNPDFEEFSMLEDLSVFDPAEEVSSDPPKPDSKKYLQISSLGLHGRDHETEILHQCLNKTEQKQLVMISGHSGCGKTALALSLKPAVEEQQGLYVSGKFDLYLRDQPYFGIVAACREICSAIMSLRTSRSRKRSFQAIHDDLRAVLNQQQIQILSQVIPEVQEIMDYYKDEDEVRHNYHPIISNPSEQGQESKSRFHFAFRIFFRVINRYFAPFVVTLDDLQWADAASLELMQVILTDVKNPHFLMIGLYRSNEVDLENSNKDLSSHPLTSMLYDLEKREDCYLDVTEIEVGNLEKDCVQSVVMDLMSLGTVSTEVVELASICHQRTLGNVFFLISFVSMLVEEGLLQYDYSTSGWNWDIEEIKSETDADSNLVDLMEQKMRNLPAEMGMFLSVAACLGSSFEASKLDKIWQSLDTSESQQLQAVPVQETLEAITKEGVLQSLGFSRYGWIHDKVQEAAFSLVPTDEASRFRFQVGKTLQEEMDEDEVQEHLFLIVNLLNGTTKDQLVEDEQVHLANLNFQATQKAISCSAFSSAAKYAGKGINYLPDDAWTSQYQLTLDLHSLAVEANELLGKYDDMKTYSDLVLKQRSCPLMDKVRVYSALASQLCNSGDNEGAVDLLLEVLDSLGCKFPRSFLSRKLSIVAGLIKLKMGLKKRTAQEAAGLPIMDDPAMIQILRLTDKLGTCSYLCQNEDVFSMVLIKNTGMTLKHGICDISSPSFCGVGIILTGVLDDLKGGLSFGKYALEMEKKLKCGVSLARTTWVMGFFLMPWQKPWQEACSVLLEAYSQGMSSGDTESATYAMMGYMILSTMLGKPLKQLEADCSTYSKQMEELKRYQQLDYTTLVWQYVCNMMGATSNPTLLEGDIITDLNGFVDIHRENKLMMAVTRSYQQRLFVLYGEYVRGAYLFRGHGYDWPKAGPGGPLFMDTVFTGGVASYASARITGERKFRKLALKARSTVKEWVRKHNPNCFHYEALLDAEHAALKKRTRKAERYYESSITMATRAGFLQDAALANERYCDFLLSVSNNRESAAFHLKAVKKLYLEWGATKKVSMLRQKYALLLEGEEPSNIRICSLAA